MSDDTVSQAFWHRVDGVIALANEQVKGSNIGEVSTSLLYAAARFNAFNIANASSNSRDMQTQKDEALKHFADVYKKMVEDNFEEYVQNFDSYRS